MDEYTAHMFVNDDITTAPSVADTSDREDNDNHNDTPTQNQNQNESPASDAGFPQTPPSKGLRGRVAAFRDKAGVQDRLLEK